MRIPATMPQSKEQRENRSMEGPGDSRLYAKVPPGDHNPFGLPWLNSSFQETTLPDAPWAKVRDKMLDCLAGKVEKQLSHLERRQAIFEQLGPAFTKKYFPHMENDPTILEPPAMTTEEHHKMRVDAQNWLKNSLTRVSLEMQCTLPLYPEDGGQPICGEMTEFREHTESIVKFGLERFLIKQEKDLIRAMQDEAWAAKHQDGKVKGAKVRPEMWLEMERLHKANPGLQSILRLKAPQSAGSTTSESSLKRPDTQALKDVLKTPAESPQLSGMQSDAIASHVVALLQRDPRRFPLVAAKLAGKPLPAPLRTYIWLDMLLRKERQRLKDGNVERVLREKFGKTVARGVSELGIKRATHSPISGLIDNAVIEKYDSTPSLKMYIDDNAHMREAARALNIIYVYDRSYEPYLIYWLFPLQLALRQPNSEGDHVYELAMYLSLLSHSFPTWPQVYAVAEQAFQRIQTVDAELYSHMHTIAQIEPQVNYKDFLVEAVYHEKKKALTVLKELGESNLKGKGYRDGDSPIQLLVDPVVFLRKWIGEGFVGVLDTWAVMWVWDQCFLQKWHPSVLESMCVALLMLLRKSLMKAKNYTEMKEVLLAEPYKLYTLDIQRAWVHIRRGDVVTQVPDMNRRNIGDEVSVEPPVNLPTETPAPPPQDMPALSPPSALPDVGLKKFRVELAFSPEVTKRETWIQDFRAAHLHLTCTVCFGAIKLESQESDVTPVSLGSRVNRGNKIFQLDFLTQKFLFLELDISQFDLEKEMGGQPWAVIQVSYDKNAETRVPLGWARVKICLDASKVPASGSNNGGRQGSWGVLESEDVHRLLAGKAPDNATAPGSESVLRSSTPSALITSGSTVGMKVYDPNNAKKTPVRKPSVKKAPTPRAEPTPPPAAPPSRMPDNHDPFIIHIDSVANLPDSATIVKVTGRLIRTGDISGLPDVLAFPELESSSRSPAFQYNLVVNKEGLTADKSLLIFLRVYTVEKHTLQMYVIGSCLTRAFTEEGKLRVGFHQRPLHSGMPDMSRGADSIEESSLDGAPKVPACYINLRILEFKEGTSIPADIKQSEAVTNSSEVQLIESYSESNSSVLDVVKELQATENDSNEDHEAWMRSRMDKSKKSAGNLPLTRLVNYWADVGINVYIKQAHGLPGGLFIQCFARIIPQAVGKGETFFTEHHDFTSRQTAPMWTDPPKVLRPAAADDTIVLLIQLYGLRILYTPTGKHDQPGTVTTPDGKALEFGDSALLGWAVVPLFDRGCVYEGQHSVPILKGHPDGAIQEGLGQQQPLAVLNNSNWNDSNKFENASLIVDVWDGHFNLEHLPARLTRVDALLDAVGEKNGYSRVERDTKGPQMTQMILSRLMKKEQKQGTASPIYEAEEKYFRQVMKEKFSRFMESLENDAGD